MSFIRQYLISARKKAKMSQAEAAKKLGMSQNHLSNIEQGHRQHDIGVHLLWDLSKLYRVPFQYFFYGRTKKGDKSDEYE